MESMGQVSRRLTTNNEVAEKTANAICVPADGNRRIDALTGEFGMSRNGQT
jgi:hypothetical protein